VLLAAGHSAEDKAILVVRNGEVRIENIEFRGTRVPDGNGAGIRFERGRCGCKTAASSTTRTASSPAMRPTPS
jgi:hypothetical protein